MGVIKQGILGGFSNKVGNVVGSSWKGIAVVKSRPISVANPQTAGQVSQRNAFSLASEIGSKILGSWIKPFWDRFAQKQSGYNAWVSANVGFMTNGVISNYALLVQSIGKLTAATSLAVVADDSSNTITITPTVPTLNQFSATSDIAQAVYYNATKDYWAVSGNLGNRSAGPYVISDSTMTTGDVLHVYLAYKRSDLSYVSNSTYATTTVVA